MLGKLDISISHDTEQLERVARLAQAAIDEKVADDAPTRTALNKFHTAISKTQNGRSRSRAPDRAPSIAPSIVDDAETLFDDSEGSRTVRDEDSIAPETPAPSPRKKIRGKGPPSPKRRATQQTVQEVLEDITEVSTVTDNLDAMAIKEEETSGDLSKQAVSQQSSRPRWRPEELNAHASVVSTSPEVPAVEADKAADDDKPVEAPKRRGRQPKAALSNADANVQQPPSRPARKNVRASRRQQGAAASNADVNESVVE